ncbi:MAG: hypothetical protein QOG42_1923 [Solirubrobacteraceae bacterium]|nr:hypothetical protein [Solirubrobacteraceae bacterium]
MGRIGEHRVQILERQTANLHARLSALEARFAETPAAAVAPREPATAPTEPVRGAAGRWPAPTTSPASQAPAPSTPPAVAAAPRERLDLEELLGGRVLAWTGGVAVLAGIAFLLAIAVSRGWIGPGARTLLAGAFSLALIGAGAWLHEQRRRGDAALATLSAGIAGLFTTVAVGGPVYGLLPASVALTLAFAAGALATAFAVRWESRGIGALGIVGALLAPVLAGAPSTATTLGLLWLAAASGAAVLVWQRWNWLALAVYALALGQWGWWLADANPSAGAILVVLCLFGALNVAAAIGFELRVPAARLRAASALLLTANAATLALAGWYALDAAGSTTVGRLWIGALAAAHLGVGLATRATAINRDIRMLALLLGVVLADLTAGLMLQGPVLAGAFAVTTAGFGLLARRVLAADARERVQRDELLLGLGLGGHLLLTTMQALTQAPPDALSGGDAFTFGGYAAIAATACAAFVAGRFVEDVRREWRVVLDVVALTGAAYLTAVALDGPMLAAAYAGEAVALGTIALRGRDAVAAWGAAAYLVLALGHALAFEAPPASLVDGAGDLAGAALALAAAAAAALFGMRLVARAQRELPTEAGEATVLLATRAHATLGAAGAIGLLHLASVAVVTAFAPGDDAQLLLSGLWALSGLAALVAGLRRDDRALRLGSLALLLVTIGKVFLYDLAALTALYRVGSFIGLGLLLLFAAGIWQRMRPPALPDLREAPPAAR